MPSFLMPWLHQVRMISEELVASGGTQVHEADIPEKSPKATAIQGPRVSMVLCGSLGCEGLPWPFLPREATGKQGVLEMSPGEPPMPQLIPSDPGPVLTSCTHGRVRPRL